MSIGHQEVIDFTHGETNGWALDPYPVTSIVNEAGNEFLRSDNPLYFNAMVLRKSLPGLEVGKYYEFTIALRTHGPKGMGVQVILDDGHAGVHAGLDIDLGQAQVTPGEWQQLKGFVFKRNTTVTDDVLINVYGICKLDMDEMRLSLSPLDREQVRSELSSPSPWSVFRR